LTLEKPCIRLYEEMRRSGDIMREAVLNRRQALAGGAALLLAGASAHAQDPGVAADTLTDGKPFSFETLIEMAKALASQPHAPVDQPLPDKFRSLSFDQYIKIRALKEQALWRADNLGVVIEPLHRGFIFEAPLKIFTIEDGLIRQLRYSRELFDFGALGAPETDGNLDFSGFRIFANTGTDAARGGIERAIFQGATSFRAIAEGQSFGAMARGLSIGTGSANGEEIPQFRSIFIERPILGNPLTLYALADSPSLTGAMRFRLAFADTTIIDIEETVCARKDITSYGIGGLQTTYYFGGADRDGISDVRAAAFENDVLSIERGNGEWVVRPLANPTDIAVSAFMDANPKGFALLQRHRAPEDFEDDVQRFERRPSVVIEALEEWGDGAVVLVEIPASNDINDNVVAFWQPATGLATGESRRFHYRQHWCVEPVRGTTGMKIRQTRSGLVPTQPGRRRFIVDFEDPKNPLPDPSSVQAILSASVGSFPLQRIIAHRDRKILRLTFDFEKPDSAVAELRAVLQPDGLPASETWLFRLA
jgi:periplasmic glucans biosynthesis protein